MMNPNLLATMLTPTTSAPAPAPAPAPGSGGEPGAFGRELQRAEKASQDERPDKPTAEPRADQAAAERQRSERRTAQAAERRTGETGKAAKTPEDPADGSTDSAAAPAAIDATAEAAPDAAAVAAADAATPGAEARPDVAAWLAQMAQRLELARERTGSAARGTSNPADGRAGAADDAAEPGLIAVAEGAAATPGSDRLPAPAADRARAVGVRAEAQAAPTATAVLTAQAETRAAFGAVLGNAVAAAAAGARPETGRTDASPALAAAAASAAAVGNDTPTPATPTLVAEDSLAPPVGSRDFAQALGARVAVFARDGVEHARLNLNPAELGPISLKLALDGTQLRVDMVADAAQTRQVLEQSLPGLASALRDAGLTLSGGGVFQQARDGGNGFGEPAQPGRSGLRGADGAAPDLPEPALVSRPVRLDGLVDLYA
jgi:flagellar hook-length control protein FliK